MHVVFDFHFGLFYYSLASEMPGAYSVQVVHKYVILLDSFRLGFLYEVDFRVPIFAAT